MNAGNAWLYRRRWLANASALLMGSLATLFGLFKSVKTIAAGETVSLRFFSKQGTYVMVPSGLKMAPIGGPELFDSIARSLPASVINSAAVQRQNHPTADCLGCAKSEKAL